MNSWTVCGYCCERVMCDDSGVHAKPHNCEMLQGLKKKMDAALSDIQKDYKIKIQEINGTLRNHRSLNAHLESEISKLKKELSTCIDVKLLYSDRQARETWQTGCEVMINTLQKRISDMDWMIKNSYVCVDNSHVCDSIKSFENKGVFFPSIDELNRKVKEELKGTNPKDVMFNECNFIPPDAFDKVFPKIKSGQVHVWQTGQIKVHHPSRKHLEGKLREKNQLIKQMDETTDYLNEQLDEKYDRIRDLEKQLAARNAECQNALNDVQKRREKVHFLNENWNKSQAEVEQLNERIGVLSECLDRKQAEINTLTFKLEHYNCKRICCLQPDGRYVNALHTR